MKEKIAWITPDCFYDVDKPIVHALQSFYDIYWVVIWNCSSVLEKPKDGLISMFLNPPFKGRDPRYTIVYLKVFKNIKKFGAKLVYCGSLGIPYLYPIGFMMINRQRFIHEGHEMEPEKWNLGWVFRKYYDFFSKRVGMIQIFSKHVLERYRRLHPNVPCIYIPMVPKDYGKATERFDFNHKVVFLCYGGIRPNKKVDLLIRSFLAVDVELRKNAKLLIYGKTSQECCDKEYIKLVEGHPEINLHLEYVHNALVSKLFASATFAVFPYSEVAQSGSMMVALNYNVPIICSDIPGFTERVKNNIDGFVFKNGDEADLTYTLEKCISLPLEGYRRIKTNQATFVSQEYSLNVIVKKYRQMLDNQIRICEI